MQYLTFIWSGLSGLRALWKHLKALDKQGVSMFSDGWAMEVRKWLEIHALRLAMHEDKAFAKTFKTYSRLIRCAMIVLKSDQLANIDSAMGDDKKLQAAIDALNNKQTLYLRPGQPGTSGYHQP